MSLSTSQLQAAADLLGAAPTLREGAAQWRTHHPGVRAIVVDPMDMRGETAALELGRRRVYLAASNGHCWYVTQQPEQADALILTEA